MPQSKSILEELLDPISRCLTTDSARALVRFRPSVKVQRRISRLAEKCNEGQQTEAERTEYESYVMVLDLLAILQSKARMLLQRRRGA